MKRHVLIVGIALLSTFVTNRVSAEESIDALLPPPFWLRSRAAELDIDIETRQQMELAYQKAEPKYHVIKEKVERLTERLRHSLVADELDQDIVVARMKAVLDAEHELKLHQTRARLSLFTLISPEQRQAARELATQKPNADWRGVMAAKVKRVQELGRRMKESGRSTTEVENRMKEIESKIDDGMIIEGARMLDQVIRELEKHGE